MVAGNPTPDQTGARGGLCHQGALRPSPMAPGEAAAGQVVPLATPRSPYLQEPARRGLHLDTAPAWVFPLRSPGAAEHGSLGPALGKDGRCLQATRLTSLRCDSRAPRRRRRRRRCRCSPPPPPPVGPSDGQGRHLYPRKRDALNLGELRSAVLSSSPVPPAPRTWGWDCRAGLRGEPPFWVRRRARSRPGRPCGDAPAPARPFQWPGVGRWLVPFGERTGGHWRELVLFESGTVFESCRLRSPSDRGRGCRFKAPGSSAPEEGPRRRGRPACLVNTPVTLKTTCAPPHRTSQRTAPLPGDPNTRPSQLLGVAGPPFLS